MRSKNGPRQYDVDNHNQSLFCCATCPVPNDNKEVLRIFSHYISSIGTSLNTAPHQILICSVDLTAGTISRATHFRRHMVSH
jgi:hypothetical protein